MSLEIDGYVCVLIHGEECINNNDCEKCDYGIDERLFKEDSISG